MNKKVRHLLSVAILIVLGTFYQNSYSGTFNPYETKELSFTIKSDSLRLYGDLQIPPFFLDQTPLVIALHMNRNNSRSYNDFISFVDGNICGGNPVKMYYCPYIIAFDLRGHGRSTTKGQDTTTYEDRDENEYKKIPSDIAYAVNEMLSDTSLNIDTNRIYVIGASVGANVAIMLTEHLPIVSKVVMLSPGEKYIGLEPARALKLFDGKVLIFAGKEDNYSYHSSQNFAKIDTTRIELEILETGNHGTNIINNDSTAMKRMVNWLLLYE
ncbi:MAG: alpha/beta fold hydrolase [candidate division Zixibacteria bacterium]|nr:alpha/beta fold hydrolase [candidate division Zixibacteria bacterium]